MSQEVEVLPDGVENTVPMPVKKRRGGAVRKHRFMELRERGWSYWVATEASEASVAQMASRAGKDLGWTFTVKVEERDGVRGVRVWRVR